MSTVGQWYYNHFKPNILNEEAEPKREELAQFFVFYVLQNENVALAY